jgi:hypothetical protein
MSGKSGDDRTPQHGGAGTGQAPACIRVAVAGWRGERGERGERGRGSR